MNIKSLQIQMHSLSLCFAFFKRKMALFLLILIFINFKIIFSYMNRLLFSFTNQLDSVIVEHRIFYYSVLLSINTLVLISAYIRYKFHKKRCNKN